ncbi:MAG: hypothetical protein ACR2KK_10330 [Acidimicrobiales bacterium]
MIRRTMRFCFRLGLMAGIGLALFKLMQGRRSASEFGSPSADWAPPPAPNPNLPRTPPEPELVEPVMFEEIIEKKAAIRAVPDPGPAPVLAPAPEPRPVAGPPAAKKAPARRAPAKKATPPPPAAAGPVKKVAPPKAAAKKAPPPAPVAKKAAPPADTAPVAKKAAPVKKAPKKSQ